MTLEGKIMVAIFDQFLFTIHKYPFFWPKMLHECKRDLSEIKTSVFQRSFFHNFQTILFLSLTLIYINSQFEYL